MRRTAHPAGLASCMLLAIATIVAAAPPVAAQDPPTVSQVPGLQAVEVDIFTAEDADMVLSLQQAVDLAIERSFSVYSWQQSFLSSAYGLEAAQRALRTNIRYNGTLPSISEGINAYLFADDLVYLRSGTMSVNSRISVTQPLITDGTISLVTSMTGFDSFSERTSGGQLESRSVQPKIGIEFNQPLFQYNNIKGSLRIAEIAFERNELRYTQDELQRINTITRQFYQLYRQQLNLVLAADSFRQSDVNYQTGRRKYQAGLVAEVEQLGLEVQRANAEYDLEAARTAHQNQQFTFNRQVGLPLETSIWVEADLEYRPIEVDVERAVELALQNRSDVRQQEIALEQSNLSLQRTVSQGRPNLQLNAGYDITGNSTLAGLGSPDSWQDHLSAAFKNTSPNTNVSLSLAIPLFDWGRTTSTIQSQIANLRVQERQVLEAEQDLRRDVINAVQSVLSAQRQYEIQQQNVTVAETSYGINQQRYERGEITITDLLREQDAYRNTQQRFNNSLIDYNMAKADLKELTLWDWETNQAVQQVTTPPRPFERNR